MNVRHSIDTVERHIDGYRWGEAHRELQHLAVSLPDSCNQNDRAYLELLRVYAATVMQRDVPDASEVARGITDTVDLSSSYGIALAAVAWCRADANAYRRFRYPLRDVVGSADVPVPLRVRVAGMMRLADVKWMQEHAAEVYSWADATERLVAYDSMVDAYVRNDEADARSVWELVLDTGDNGARHFVRSNIEAITVRFSPQLAIDMCADALQLCVRQRRAVSSSFDVGLLQVERSRYSMQLGQLMLPTSDDPFHAILVSIDVIGELIDVLACEDLIGQRDTVELGLGSFLRTMRECLDVIPDYAERHPAERNRISLLLEQVQAVTGNGDVVERCVDLTERLAVESR